MPATANGASIQSLRIKMPYRGVWFAELMVDADDPASVTGAVTIEVGTTRLVGTALRPGADPGGQTMVKVIGGAGRLTEGIPPAAYVSTSVADVVGAILSLVGERLSTKSDADTLSKPLARWNRGRGDAGSCLSAVAKANGFVWRMLDDGTVWVGNDTFADAGADIDTVASTPDQGTIEAADDELVLRPGQSYKGSKIYEVESVIGAKSTRSTLTTTEGGGRIARADAARAKRQLEEAGYPFAKTYAGIVTSQNGDGTVEVKIDDGKDVHSQSRVPLRHGLPGVTKLELEARAEVVLGFDDGDPQKPYAALPLKGGRLLHLTVDADVVEVGGTDPVAMYPGLEIWATQVTAALTAVSALTASPGPVISPGSPVPPVSPLSAASTKLFSS